MKLVSWNLRGLNSPGKLRMLKNMIKMENPQICLLQETKCNGTTLGSILTKAWPGCRSVAVDASGASGGLAIAWNTQAIDLSDFHASHHLIQAAFHILGTNVHGNLSNVYFPQDTGSKIALLDTIEALNNNRTHPLWIIGGDFNMITKLEEKIGGEKQTGTRKPPFQGLHPKCLPHRCAFLQWNIHMEQSQSGKTPNFIQTRSHPYLR